MWFFYNNVLANLLPFLVVGLVLWAVAYRRLRRNRLAMAALAVIGIYAAVAFLDSVGWMENKNATRRSVIDRVFARTPERTYSAPLAKETTGEPKPQALKERHVLGTDGVGQDVFYRTLKGARTAFILGGLTWAIVTPLALLLGM